MKDLSNISFKNKDFYSLQPVCVNELPNYAKWKSNLDEILSDIENQKIKKLVLARKVTKEFAHAVDALQIITYLKQNINLAYHFYWQYEENIAFVGASPEQLYKRENRRIYTEAQAGTRPRGSCESDDSQYAEELLNSDKDKLEHDYVLNEIESILKDLCLDFGLTTHRDIIKLSKVQHLRSCFSGILKNGIDDFVILEKLHPTSAVCGLPKKKALEKIAELEPFERGYYAGAIGYLSKDYAEFCVGIRSVLVEENQLSLYAGAGIVKGSKPNEEWQEIQNKMSLFERICHEPLPK